RTDTRNPPPAASATPALERMPPSRVRLSTHPAGIAIDWNTARVGVVDDSANVARMLTATNTTARGVLSCARRPTTTKTTVNTASARAAIHHRESVGAPVARMAEHAATITTSAASHQRDLS